MQSTVTCNNKAVLNLTDCLSLHPKHLVRELLALVGLEPDTETESKKLSGFIILNSSLSCKVCSN